VTIYESIFLRDPTLEDRVHALVSEIPARPDQITVESFYDPEDPDYHLTIDLYPASCAQRDVWVDEVRRRLRERLGITDAPTGSELGLRGLWRRPMHTDYEMTVEGPYQPVAAALRSSSLVDDCEEVGDWMSFVVGGTTLGTAGWDATDQATLVIIADPAGHELLPQMIYDALTEALPYEVTLYGPDDVVLHRRDGAAAG
jgi:hypothetical protein